MCRFRTWKAPSRRAWRGLAVDHVPLGKARSLGIFSRHLDRDIDATTVAVGAAHRNRPTMLGYACMRPSIPATKLIRLDWAFS